MSDKPVPIWRDKQTLAIVAGQVLVVLFAIFALALVWFLVIKFAPSGGCESERSGTRPICEGP